MAISDESKIKQTTNIMNLTPRITDVFCRVQKRGTATGKRQELIVCVRELIVLKCLIRLVQISKVKVLYFPVQVSSAICADRRSSQASDIPAHFR